MTVIYWLCLTLLPMSTKILIPKGYYELTREDGPIFFLAGPVRGGDDWQKKVVEELSKHLEKCVVAIPYYYIENDYFPLRESAERGIEGKFERQLQWERFYLEEAANKGCIIFWLPEESRTNPRPASAGAYATDTRGELGRWSVEQKYNPGYNIVVGAEENFPSLSQIKRNWIADQEHHVVFPDTIESLVEKAVKKVKASNL